MCKTNYPELEKMVERLDNIDGIGDSENRRRVEVLQEIGNKLINEYYIQIDDVTIEPLLVEAYYYHKEKFKDISVYAVKDSQAPTYELARERQKNNFGKLFIHYGTNDGIDIVLSLNDHYYLSFLIKNALVNGEWKSQCNISKTICGKCNRHDSCKGKGCKYYEKPVLIQTKSKKWEIVFTQRKGIHNDFATKPLAALPIDVIRKYPFTASESRTNIVKRYIDIKYAEGTIDKKENKRIKELAYGLIALKNTEK